MGPHNVHLMSIVEISPRERLVEVRHFNCPNSNHLKDPTDSVIPAMICCTKRAHGLKEHELA